MKTTLGQLLINETLPPELRDYSRKMDKKSMNALLTQIAEQYPDKYKEISHNLLTVGENVSYNEGTSVSLKDLRTAKVKTLAMAALQGRINKITSNSTLSNKQKNDKIVEETGKVLATLSNEVMAESIADGNMLASFAESGARGGASAVNAIRGAPLLVKDNMGRPVPIPITHNYSEGLDPAEMFATSYGVRQGFAEIKAGTPKVGYLGKQLANASHRLITSKARPLAGTGLPVDTDDPDNEGAVLARDYGQFKAGTVITPKVLKELKRKNKRILVHSPISAVSDSRGVPQWAFGIREKGRFPNIGENVGISVAPAVAEPLTQAAISAKHVAGVVGATGKGGSSSDSRGGFDTVNTMVNIPKEFEDKASVSTVDGVITGIEKAPQGGTYIHVGKEKFYSHLEPIVKTGQTVEAGDVLSEGLPSPADIVRYKGIGEGRRQFMLSLHKTLQNSGVNVSRRNTEVLSRALVRHVQIKDADDLPDGYLPDDIVEYDTLAASYVPRKNSRAAKLGQAKNTYLEQPLLHYSIGTRLTPRVLAELKEFGVTDVMVNDKEPAFEPAMQRAVDSLAHDEDWMVQLGGFNLTKNFLKSVHRGASSTEHGTSYIPSIAKATGFGRAKDGDLPY